MLKKPEMEKAVLLWRGRLYCGQCGLRDSARAVILGNFESIPRSSNKIGVALGGK